MAVVPTSKKANKGESNPTTPATTADDTGRKCTACETKSSSSSMPSRKLPDQYPHIYRWYNDLKTSRDYGSGSPPPATATSSSSSTVTTVASDATPSSSPRAITRDDVYQYTLAFARLSQLVRLTNIHHYDQQPSSHHNGSTTTTATPTNEPSSTADNKCDDNTSVVNDTGTTMVAPVANRARQKYTSTVRRSGTPEPTEIRMSPPSQPGVSPYYKSTHNNDGNAPSAPTVINSSRAYFLILPRAYQRIVRTVLGLATYRRRAISSDSSGATTVITINEPLYPQCYWYRLPSAIVLNILEWSLPPLNVSPLQQCQHHIEVPKK
jgi:hypothetical protein